MRLIFLTPLFILLVSLGALAQTSPTVDANPTPARATEADNEAARALIESIEENDLVRVLKLLDSGASPDATDDGTPAIILAVRSNNFAIAEALLSKKAKVDQVEKDGTTALQVAASIGQSKLVKLLIAHRADVNLGDHNGHTPLLLASFGVLYKSAPDWLVKSLFGSDDDTDDLWKDIGSEHLECAKLLLQAGANVNAQGADCGLSALMVAATCGNVELTRLLLEHHADVNLSNGEYTALKFTEMFESPKELQELLDDNNSAEHKQAFFDWAHFTAPGRTRVAGMLRQAGAK